MEENKEPKVTVETGVALKTEMQKSLDSINEKLQAIQTIQTSPFKTNGSFMPTEFHPSGSSVDVRTATNIKYLIWALGQIKIQSDAHEYVYQKELGLQTYPVFTTYGGYSYEDWKHDIKLRLSILMQADTVKKLNEAKAKLEQFLTQDDRLALALKEIGELTK